MATQFLSAFSTIGAGVRRRAAARGTALVALRTLRTRAELADLSPRLLADIGVAPAEARREAERAPWDFGGAAHSRPGRRPHQRAPGTAFARFLREAWRRHRTRQLLADLDAAALRDIGVSRGMADAEANKPFWRP